MERTKRIIHDLLIGRNLTIGVAESCTAGMLTNALTIYPGSSKYMLLGVIAYSNAAKESILKIPQTVITRKGAVSKEVAKLMCRNIMKISKAKIGIAITGIAGPSGGTFLKPKGTVFIAVADRKKILCKKFIFKGTRGEVIKQSVLRSLNLIRTIIKKG